MTSSMAAARLVRLAMEGLRKALSSMSIGLLLMVGAALWAGDPPHNISVANAYGTLNLCSACHKNHGAVGGVLGTVSGNSNLCMSCHVSGGRATNKPFGAADQAVPAGLVGSTAGGTSHRWDSGPQGRLIKGTPNSSTATITPSGAYTGAYASTIRIKISTTAGGATGIAKFDWSMTPAGSTTFGTITTGVATSTTATALGTTGVALAFSSTGTFVPDDIFYLYVRADLRAPTSPAMASRLENGKIMCSTCHDEHLQVNAPFDPAASPTYTAGTTNNRHFQRVANSAGAMCGDCHAARNVGKGGTSHPVHVNLAAAPNTKTPSASLILSTAGNVECLSCHDIHGAPTATTPAGMLLRVSNSLALCTDCHTLADTATANAHTNPTTGIIWPGDQYGGSTYPALTATDRGACKNCHTPHGWPDASNPTQEYGKGFGARQDNLCLTCHDGAPAKDVRTDILKTNHHPVERTSGGRLVGCGGCHNPHMATAGVRTYTTPADANRNRLRADVGGVLNNMYALRGVDGVAISTATTAWTVPTFTKIPGGSPGTANSGAVFEYQVCFKCHTSYDSYGAIRPGGITNYYNTGTAKFINNGAAAGTVTGISTVWTATMVGMYIQKDISSPAYKIATFVSATSLTLSTAYAGTSDAVAAGYTITRQQTDLAQEFNPANRSAHPVVNSLSAQTGSGAPKALLATQMVAPWTNVGVQTMMCSDCHNTDGVAAQGPHGSAAQFMLRTFVGGPPTTNWPNVTLTNALTLTVSAQAWCQNCHVIKPGITNVIHDKNSGHMGHTCYNCHVQIPHGSKMSRLLGANINMPARYAYQNNLTNMVMLQFVKTGPTAYGSGNCATTVKHGATIPNGETW